MLRAFKYPLRPTPAQERTLITWLVLGCELYNGGLQERRDAWRQRGVSLSRMTQERELPEVRAARPEFSDVPIVFLRGWLRRLDKAMRAFFRRCKAGGVPGYPRFKSRSRFDTVDLDDLCGARYGRIVAGGKRIMVPGMGKVRFKQHRPLEGTPKALRIKREGGRWYVVFLCVAVPTKPLPPTGSDVGIDLGLRTLVATSDGELIPPPALEQAQADLLRAQRRVSKRKRGSRRRRLAVSWLQKHHARVANIRREHAISTAKSLVARYDTIVREDLNVKGLARGMLAGPVANAAWSTFTHWLDVKAEEAARQVVLVDPRGTSQLCSACGATVSKDLAVRVHRCPCGYVADRDVNAARNILGRGLRLRRGDLDVAQAPMTREASL